MGAMGDNASPVSHLVRQGFMKGSDPFHGVKRDLPPFRQGAAPGVQGLT